jgi:Methyltransferase domain
MTTYNNRVELLTAVPANARMAEIGVFDGDFAGSILRVCKPRALYLVDCWQGAFSSGDQDGRNIRTLPDMEATYLSLCRRYQDHGSVRLVRATSSKFLSDWSDDFFDSVYIDADHSFAAVLSDLSLSVRVVRDGGLIMGHDYNDPAVGSAVREFCSSHGQRVIGVANDALTSFMIRLDRNKIPVKSL